MLASGLYISMFNPAHTWFLKNCFCLGSCFVCVCVCVCVHSQGYELLLASCGMIWIEYDWLNKFYKFYMAPVVSIFSRHDLRIEVCMS